VIFAYQNELQSIGLRPNCSH